MSVGQIKVVMTLDDNGFSSKITQNGKELQKLNSHLATTASATKNLDKHFSSLGHSFREFVVTTSLAKGALQNIWSVTGGVAKGIADTNGEIERMTMLMKGMSNASTEAGRSAEAQSNVAAIFDMAKNAPIDVKALTDTYVKLRTTGIDPLNGSMQALIDANAHFGGTSDTLHRASIAIQQMASKGVISMEELRQQLAEAIPNASALMAQGLGMSIADLNEKISKGMVKSKQALGALTEEMEYAFSGSAKAMMDTWTGLMANLETEWTLFQKNIGDASYFKEAKDAMRELVGVFRTDEAQAAAAQFGHALGEVTRNVVEMTKYLLANREEIGNWIKAAAEVYVVVKSWGMVSAAIAGVTAAVTTVGAEFVAAGALIVETGEILTVTTMLAETLGAGLLAMVTPIGAITAALAVGAIAWANWGKSAEEAVASANQSIIDGVRLSKEQIKDLNNAIDQGTEASKRIEARKNGNIFQKANLFADDLLSGGMALVDDQEAARQAKNASNQLFLDETLTKPKLEAKRIIQAQKEASEEVISGIVKNAAAEREAKRKAVFGDDITKLSNDEIRKRQPEYVAFVDSQRGRVEQQEIEAVQRVTEEKIREAGSNKELAESLRKLGEERVSTIRQTQAERALNRANALGEGKNKADTAAKEAKKDANELENHLAMLDAQLAKKRALLAQPIKMGAAGSDTVGPEEAKIRSLMESGKNFSELNVKQARSLDQVNKALQDKAKIEETLASVERQGKKALEGLITDNEHLQEVVDNGGYETQSAELRRYNEQIDLQREKINESKEALISHLGVDAEMDAALKTQIATIEENAKAFEKRAEEIKKAAEANLNLKREADAEINAEALNVSMISNAKERADAEFAITKKRYLAERHLTEEQIKSNLKDYGNQYKELQAMEERHARDMEHPLQTLARDWSDTTEQMRQASVGWVESFTDGIVDMAMTGKASFADMTKSILADIAKIMVRKQMANLIEAGSNAAGDSSMWSGMGSSLMSMGSSPVSLFAFEKGGIMSSAGKLPVTYYSKGGVANSPQVSVFGEGRMNEAYVPLPDGKSIPVTMNDGGKSGNVYNVSISVESSGNESPSQVGQKIAESFIRTVAREEIASATRPGNRLNSTTSF